jgi:hypothetical protein
MGRCAIKVFKVTQRRVIRKKSHKRIKKNKRLSCTRGKFIKENSLSHGDHLTSYSIPKENPKIAILDATTTSQPQSTNFIEEYDILSYFLNNLRINLNVRQQQLALELLFRHYNNNIIYLNILGTRVENCLKGLKLKLC